MAGSNGIKKALLSASAFLICGEGGIRTLGTRNAYNGFRDRPVQPLRHLSVITKRTKLKL